MQISRESKINHSKRFSSRIIDKKKFIVPDLKITI